MINTVILEGRVTTDIECKYAARNGEQMAVARFSMALDRGKDKEGNSRGADFPNIVAFGRTAETLEKYVGKGCRVEILGHIQTGSYEKDGRTIYTTDVIADRTSIVDFKDSNKKAAAAPAESEPVQEEMPTGFQQLDDDIPF